jgi:hypothetical protein
MKVQFGKNRRLGRGGLICLLFFWISSLSALKATDLEREFVWKTFGQVETLKVRVPAAMYTHYSAKSRHFQYGNYLKEDAGFELTARLAGAFERRAAEENFTEWEKINMVVDFIQSLEYQSETGEYPKYPIETLHDGGGDCEDTSILLASILDKMGIDCVLLSPPGHMSVGLAITGLSGHHYLWAGKKYFYVETTGKNWKIGAIPTAYEGTAKIYAIPASIQERRAVVAHSIATEAVGEETVLMFAFNRSPVSLENQSSQKKMYRYSVHLECDDASLQEIQEVQYRKVSAIASEQGKIPWMRAYDASDFFRQEWTDPSHGPIQVRVFFKDGSIAQNLINFPPKMKSD